MLLDLPHSREYFLSLFRAYNLEPRIVHRTRSYDMVRGLVGRHRGYGILNAIPRMPYTYDGTRVIALPIQEDLPRTLVVGLRLRQAMLRRAVVALQHLRARAISRRNGRPSSMRRRRGAGTRRAAPQ